VVVDPGDPEGVGGGTGGDDEVVEGEVLDLVLRVLEVQDPGVEVGADHRGLPEGQVVLAGGDAPDRVGHVGAGQARGGHLVEQRLEGVEVVLVHERHVDGRLRQLPCRSEATEPRPDDHHLQPFHGTSLRTRDPALCVSSQSCSRLRDVAPQGTLAR